MADRNKVMQALIKKMTEFYNVQGSNMVSDKYVSAIKDSVDAGVLNFLGLTQHNEQSMQMLGEIKEKALAASRKGNPSALSRGFSKLKGMIKEKKRGGGSVGYTQRWKNARKKNG